MTVSEAQIERGMKALHEASTYRGYNQETLDREWVRMERIYRAHVTAILIAALSDQAGGWQDISTAPKDEMFIYFESRDGKRCIGLAYHAKGGGWRDSEGNWTYRLNPTHWMPLPAPPPSSTAGEG